VLGDVLYVSEGDPTLSVGDRYLLFLNTNNTSEFQDLGGITACDGDVCGFWAYLDEYRVADHLEAKVLLRDGATTAPQDPNQGQPVDWQFLDGTTLLGMPKADAIAAIQAAIPPADPPTDPPPPGP
jgi:hypothetical protein